MSALSIAIGGAVFLGAFLASFALATTLGRWLRRRQEREEDWQRLIDACTLLEVDRRCDVCGMASETSMCDRCWSEVDLAYERLMDR